MVKEKKITRIIENQSKKFKQRALNSPGDSKRHDRIRQDEKKWMWTAYHELGWSFAKIASVLNRDPRSTKEAIETYESTAQEIPKNVVPPVESIAAEETKQAQNNQHLRVMVSRDVLELAAKARDDLSRIDAFDGAVYQLHGTPWTSDIPSVLHVSHYPELKVVLAIENDQPGQFLLLTEQLEAISSGFSVEFRKWESQFLTPFVGRCQEIIREIWYRAREGTGLEMSFDRGYTLPHEYGLLQNVPLFVWRFALKHCAESNPPEPELELNPADVDRFPYLPPHYRQLTGRDEPNLLLAAGFGPVVDHSRGITIDVMDLCQTVIFELCQLYVKDARIREIVREQETIKKQIELFREALADLLSGII